LPHSYREVRTKVYNQLYAPCVENMVGPNWVEPVQPGVIVGCVLAGLIVVAAVVVGVWHVKRKPPRLVVTKTGGTAEPFMGA
jgi:hypothetical protein